MDPILFDDRGGNAKRPAQDPDALDLFDPPPHNGTPTSVDAAEAIEPQASRLRRLVLDAVLVRGTVGATREELESLTNLPGNTVRPRVAELLAKGDLVERGTRPTASGRNAAILVGRGVR